MEVFKKNPIYVKEFKSDNWFELLESFGNWIVFRNQVSSHIIRPETKLKPTIDLIFVEAMFLEISTLFTGVKITRPKDALSIQYSKKYDKGDDFLEAGERTYAIESQGERYNVVSSNLWIHVYNQQIRTSPSEFIGDLEKRNYYLENFIEKWIKID